MTKAKHNFVYLMLYHNVWIMNDWLMALYIVGNNSLLDLEIVRLHQLLYELDQQEEGFDGILHAFLM